MCGGARQFVGGGSRVPQLMRDCPESHVNKRLFQHTGIEAEISAEIEQWSLVKEDKLVAAWPKPKRG